MPIIVTPYVPTYITVHLGTPDSDAENVTVSFLDYIKNVASSEVYPTWHVSALRANILAQVSFALNRVYTEFYPSQGYDFNITASTAYDQKFIKGRNIFESVSTLVDALFTAVQGLQSPWPPVSATAPPPPVMACPSGAANTWRRRDTIPWKSCSITMGKT